MSDAREFQGFWNKVWALVLGDELGNQSDGNMFSPQFQRSKFQVVSGSRKSY